MNIHLRTVTSFILLCLLFLSANIRSKEEYEYGIPATAWLESFGNHRAILQINKTAQVVTLDFQWRRPDADIAKRRFYIINATTGDTIRNIKRIEVNNERCKIVFGPVVKKGLYYFYYLPYYVQPGSGNYSNDYEPAEPAPEVKWIEKYVNKKQYPKADVIKVEARTAFDTFFPMELIATKDELERYIGNNCKKVSVSTEQKCNFLLFPELRDYPIRMRTYVPVKWLNIKQGCSLTDEVAPNEYFAFQIGVWAPKNEVKQLSYIATDLIGAIGKIPASAITCFNVEGVDPKGTSFTKIVNVSAGNVKPLWFGIDVASDQAPGIYKGKIFIRDATGEERAVPVCLTVKGNFVADRGDSEPWRHSRLRWLNSTLGIDDTPTSSYTSMSVNDCMINCLGRTFRLDNRTALPAQIDSWGNQILFAPVRFVILTANGEKILHAKPVITESTMGHVTIHWLAEDDDLKVEATNRFEFDGWTHYSYLITPKKIVVVKDILLEIPIKNEVAEYTMGMGLPGQVTPKQYEGKWNTPEMTVNNWGVSIPTSKDQNWLWPFDSFWIGNAHAGIHCELRGTSYSGPMLNLYQPAYPESWHNNGKGGFRIKREKNVTKALVYSGERTLEISRPIVFEFATLITPVKKINLKSQFSDRYYHNGRDPVPTDFDVRAGVRIINIHHANKYNPVINYPFLSVDKLKNLTSEWHKKDCKVKLYYTLRELTSAATEIWAIRGLDNEILSGGKGGGFPWCREHFVTDYTPQWYHHFDSLEETGFTADVATLTAEGDSRWYNYYVEGLAWMVKNIGIDGIYMDDVSFDRSILKRMRHAMEQVKPGCIIDLHSNTGFSKGPAIQYTEFFPYIDKLWFGESFLYDKMTSANWLVASSGIPFGLMGDMLYAGGNKWLGMQYGMTVRHPWETEGVVCDPRVIWKIWDDFGIADSKMVGFWEDTPVVIASDSAVLATGYLKQDEALISIGNYSDEAKNVKLSYNWKKLGIDSLKVKLIVPEIPTFQSAATYSVDDLITIQPRKGLLFYLKLQ